MITGLHTLLYSADPDATRAFLRDVVQLPGVDTGGGWIIFRTGPSELGVHPTSGQHEGESYATSERHELSLMCDDLDATMSDLRGRGAEFSREPRDEGWGVTVDLVVPGMTSTVLLYQPRYDPPAFG